MKLLTCLLNWRTADMTLRALEKVLVELRTIPGGARVCVVDNDSQDGSFEKIAAAVKERGWDDVVDVVASGRNGGFGFGNNVAFRRGLGATGDARPDFFYLLNSDAFPDPGALTALLDHFEHNPRTGLAGSYIHGLDGHAQESSFHFPTPLGEMERTAHLGVLATVLKDKRIVMPVPAATTLVDWVAGASLMIRREVLEQVGLFDETFFLYYEETDLCLRAKRAGWNCAYVRESSVAHIGGASTGVQSHTRVQKRMPKYVFESRRHYFLKNHGRAFLWAANAGMFLGGASFRVRRALQKKPDPERPREWLDGVLFNVMHP
jgi:N-acetylglucosaminyl-diphospho-decaprenol L-rhamnosyltransferase